MAIQEYYSQCLKDAPPKKDTPAKEYSPPAPPAAEYTPPTKEYSPPATETPEVAKYSKPSTPYRRRQIVSDVTNNGKTSVGR